MRLAFAAVLFCASAAFAQTELPPTWSTSQGDSIQNQAQPPKVTAAARMAAAQASTQQSPAQPSAQLSAPAAYAATPAPTYASPNVPAYSPAAAAPAVASPAYASNGNLPSPSRRSSSNLPPPAPRAVQQPAPSQPVQQPVPQPSRTSMPAAGTLIDISAPLDPRTTPVYEGNPPIQFSFTADMDHGDPLDLSLYSFGSHTGTHIDAPLHFLKGAATIDQVPLPQLIGPARVIDIDPRTPAITAAELERYNWRGASRILFRTRNSVNNWIVDPVFHRDFVYIAPDAAELMASSGVELVGIDYLSVEQFGAAAPQAHINMLRRGCIIAEGLDLRGVAPGDYKLTILPLKIMGHEAAPARAVLEVLP